MSTQVIAPKGTKTNPITKKCRMISNFNTTLIVSIPKEICHLLSIQAGDRFTTFCDLKTKSITLKLQPEEEDKSNS